MMLTEAQIRRLANLPATYGGSVPEFVEGSVTMELTPGRLGSVDVRISDAGRLILQQHELLVAQEKRVRELELRLSLARSETDMVVAQMVCERLSTRPSSAESGDAEAALIAAETVQEVALQALLAAGFRP